MILSKKFYYTYIQKTFLSFSNGTENPSSVENFPSQNGKLLPQIIPPERIYPSKKTPGE